MGSDNADKPFANEIRRIERSACLAEIAGSVVGLGLIGCALLLSDSRTVAYLTAAVFITAALTTFDKRVTQAKMHGTWFQRVGPFQPIGPDTLGPGGWIAAVYWIDRGLLVALFVVNWKSGALVYLGGFVLASTGFLETAGGILLAPFKARR